MANQNPGTVPINNPNQAPSTSGTGQVVVPDYGIGVSSTAPSSMDVPSGYPKNPAALPQVNTDIAAGIPANVPTISQGIQMMQTCNNCGQAFPPDQFATHLQRAHEEPYGSLIYPEQASTFPSLT